MYAERNIRLDEAERLIRRALKISPENPAFLDSLGWVLFQKGDLDPSLAALERAAATENPDPVILEHLAECLLAQGEPGRAVEEFERALAAGGDEETLRARLEAAREKIESTEPEATPSGVGVEETRP